MSQVVVHQVLLLLLLMVVVKSNLTSSSYELVYRNRKIDESTEVLKDKEQVPLLRCTSLCHVTAGCKWFQFNKTSGSSGHCRLYDLQVEDVTDSLVFAANVSIYSRKKMNQAMDTTTLAESSSQATTEASFDTTTLADFSSQATTEASSDFGCPLPDAESQRVRSKISCQNQMNFNDCRSDSNEQVQKRFRFDFSEERDFGASVRFCSQKGFSIVKMVDQMTEFLVCDLLKANVYLGDCYFLHGLVSESGSQWGPSFYRSKQNFTGFPKFFADNGPNGDPQCTAISLKSSKFGYGIVPCNRKSLGNVKFYTMCEGTPDDADDGGGGIRVPDLT